MSNLLLNLDQLNERHQKAEAIRIGIFDDILRSCHNKIKKYNNEFKKQECLLTPPVFILGTPPYNYVELIDYLIRSLRKNGFKAEFIGQKGQQHIIYVSWKPDDIDMTQYRHQQMLHNTQTDHVSGSGSGSSPYDTRIGAGDSYGGGSFGDSHDKSNFSVVSLPAQEPTATVKRKKVEPKPVIQHVAMFEYRPGAKDCIPINIGNSTK